MTNATKAAIILAVNGVLGVAIAFDVAFSQEQLGAINIALNSVLGLAVALTYKNSPKRVPDA
jgi:hypothetical protein